MDINQLQSLLAAQQAASVGSGYPYMVPDIRYDTLQCQASCKACAKLSNPGPCYNNWNLPSDEYSCIDEACCVRRCKFAVKINNLNASRSDLVTPVKPCAQEAAILQTAKNSFFACKTGCESITDTQKQNECLKGCYKNQGAAWQNALEEYAECMFAWFKNNTDDRGNPVPPIIIALDAPASKPTDTEISNNNAPVVVDNWWLSSGGSSCAWLRLMLRLLTNLYTNAGCYGSESNVSCELIDLLRKEVREELVACLVAHNESIGMSTYEQSNIEFVPPLPNDPSVPGAWGSSVNGSQITGSRFLENVSDRFSVSNTPSSNAIPPGGYPRKPPPLPPIPAGCGGSTTPSTVPNPADWACCYAAASAWYANHPATKTLKLCDANALKCHQNMVNCKNDPDCIRRVTYECDRMKPTRSECYSAKKLESDLLRTLSELYDECDAMFGGGAGTGGVSSVAPPVLPSVKYPRKLDNEQFQFGE